MAGSTPIFGFPYPQPSDLVANYPALGQDLAEDVETVLAARKMTQVLTTTKTNVFSTTSTSPVDVTGLSVTITPSATSSLVLVIAYVPFGHYASGTGQAAFIRITRAGTAVFIGDSASNRTRAGAATNSHAADWGHSTGTFAATISFIDSPATTSATTYAVQSWQTAGLGAVVGQSGLDTDAAHYARLPSSITAIEVTA